MRMGPRVLRDSVPLFQSADRELGANGDATDEAPDGRVVYATVGRLPAWVNRLCELERAVAQQAAGEMEDYRVQGASVSHGWGGGGPPRHRRFIDQASKHNDLDSHCASGISESTE